MEFPSTIIAAPAFVYKLLPFAESSILSSPAKPIILVHLSSSPLRTLACAQAS